MGAISPDHIVWMAGGAQILGYLIINQMALRLALLVGTFFYVWYYAVAAAEPLWSAIALSSVMGAANLVGIAVLLLGQSRLILPRGTADVYAHFDGITPGEFRQIMRAGSRRYVEEREQVTREDRYPDSLTYIISGGAEVTKGGHRFLLPDGVFVGEVAYVSGRRSAASTWILPGSEILEWKFVDLRQCTDRSPAFQRALQTIIAADLVAKVSQAVAPESRRSQPKTARPEFRHSDPPDQSSDDAPASREPSPSSTIM